MHFCYWTIFLFCFVLSLFLFLFYKLCVSYIWSFLIALFDGFCANVGYRSLCIIIAVFGGRKCTKSEGNILMYVDLCLFISLANGISSWANYKSNNNNNRNAWNIEINSTVMRLGSFAMANQLAARVCVCWMLSVWVSYFVVWFFHSNHSVEKSSKMTKKNQQKPKVTESGNIKIKSICLSEKERWPRFRAINSIGTMQFNRFVRSPVGLCIACYHGL